MFLDVTKNLSEEEYEVYKKLAKLYTHKKFRTHPDAPIWGDGQVIDGHDLDYEDFYHNLLTSEQEEFIQNLEFEQDDILLKLGYKYEKRLIYHEHIKPVEFLNWLNTIPYNWFYLQTVFDKTYDILFLPREYAIFYDNWFSPNATMLSKCEILHTQYGWYNEIISDIKPAYINEWLKTNCKGLYIHKGLGNLNYIWFKTPLDAMLWRLRWKNEL